jgi:pimeloyl-ACP methyl ester carboxylesterase
MSTLAARGVELNWKERGSGPPVLLIHETGTSSAAWEVLAGALAPRCRAIAYDRRGWGASTVPDEYRRTTIEEQSEDAGALISSLDAAPAVLCAAGLGAVIALDLLLRRPELVLGAVLIEPPLLQLLPEATEALSVDRRALEVAAGEGRDALIDLYLSGGLGATAAGVARIPEGLTAPVRERPASLIAELGAVPAWGMPLPRLGRAQRSSAIVTARSTPAILRSASDALASRLAHSGRSEVASAELPPQLGAAHEIAELVGEIMRARESESEPPLGPSG